MAKYKLTYNRYPYPMTFPPLYLVLYYCTILFYRVVDCDDKSLVQADSASTDDSVIGEQAASGGSKLAVKDKDYTLQMYTRLVLQMMVTIP